MSGTSVSTEPAAETPSGGDSEGMTAAELAYFRSGGEDSAALEREWSGQPEPKAAARAPASDDVGDDVDDVEDDDAGTMPGRDAKGRFVPHKAFHAVREKYKAQRDENAQLREKMARVDERLAVLNEVMGKGGEQPAEQKGDGVGEAPPDPEKDIFAYVRWQAKEIERLKSSTKADSEARLAEQAERTFKATYEADATNFLKTTPDFGDAYLHLVAGRDKELAALGMKDATERKRTIAAEERAIVQQALAQKASPAQVLYDFAMARGYAKKDKPAAANGRGEAADGDGIMQQIEKIAAGQRTAGASLSNGGGGGSSEGLTVETLLRMSDADYDAVVSKLTESQRRKLLGG